MEDFPISDLQEKTVVTTGLHPTQLSPYQPTQPHATSYPHVVARHCSSYNCQHCLLAKSTSLGLRFCPVTDFKPKLLHLASQTPQCKPLHRTASTALELTMHNQRDSAYVPPVPRPQYSPNHRQSAVYPPSTRIKSGLLQPSLRVTQSISPRMLTPNTHGLNVN